MKFGVPMQILVLRRSRDKVSKFGKIKIADGRHIENRFLAISQRFIVRLTRNLIRRSRITFRYRSRDQNTKIWKFKMADDRHFENGFITISQLRIIRFQWNLVCRCIIGFQERSHILNYQNFANSKWRTAALFVSDYMSAYRSGGCSELIGDVDCYTRINQRSVPNRNS